MLRSIHDLKNFSIQAADGEVGHVTDFYFDDEKWVIRYLVVDAGNWLSNRKVLITPISIGTPDWDANILPVALSMEQVKNSPAIDTDKPVSRQHENDYLGYYGYPGYWGGAGLWGVGMYPDLMMEGYVNNTAPVEDPGRATQIELAIQADQDRHANDDTHLRSCKEITGYTLNASDGDIGKISGMLVDEKNWAIRYLIIDTGHWWSGHQVLIAVQWIDAFLWTEQSVKVSMTRSEIKNAPLYEPDIPFGRELELQIHQHYHRRTSYWTHE